MFEVILRLIQMLGALLTVFVVAARVVESIYELRKNPELDTMGEIMQVVKNFFTIEKYDRGGVK